MNKRTVKLLKKCALVLDKNERTVKKWWGTLTPAQRTVQRKKLEALVKEKPSQEEEV